MKIIQNCCQWAKLCLLLLVACLLPLGPVIPGGSHVMVEANTALTTGFHVSGRYLLDANGNKFIMRGINHPHNWYPSQTSSFRNIKDKGANTVRVVLSSGSRWTKSTAGDVANVISLCKTNKLVCMLEVHDTTGYKEDPASVSLAQAASYWKEIKNVLIGQEAYILINIGNEPYGNIDTAGWVDDTKNAILELRNAGLHHTLVVDAPNWGQDWEFRMLNNAAGILASDPDANVLFSVHMYGVYDTAIKVEDYLSAFVNAGLPLIVGEFGHMHTDGDPAEDAILEKTVAYEIGYLGWSWSGNGSPVDALDMVVNFDPSQETWWGNRIIRGPNGICRTSLEASVYGGNRMPIACSIAREDPNPSRAAKLSFTVIFSEAVTGVSTSDFVLTTSGVSGSSITNVTGLGSAYTVTVQTGAGSGTIRLDMPGTASAQDATGQALSSLPFRFGEAYDFSTTFADVSPSHPYYQDIEILYANGLTGGCNTSPLKFCPDQIMNRAQAAVFILRGNFGNTYVPDPATHFFKDDWSKGTWAEPWAEAMRIKGLSAGCLASPLKYCPWDQIPREQAVIFALRLKYGNTYTPPAATGTLFADMTNPGYYATAWAEQAYKDGLIPNCGISAGKPKICPKDLVSRGLGAYMIVRAKNLAMP